jgi:hypothetical protein
VDEDAKFGIVYHCGALRLRSDSGIGRYGLALNAAVTAKTLRVKKLVRISGVEKRAAEGYPLYALRTSG